MQPNRPRTPLERAIYEKRASLRRVADQVGCSYEYVRLIAIGARPAKTERAQRVLTALQSLTEGIAA